VTKSLVPRASRRTVALLAAAATTAVTGAAALGAGSAAASSHREAPMISGLPQLDNTDVYAFVSPDDKSKVNLIANWLPFEEPAGGPNFYFFDPGALYDIHVDNNGDAKADITYRWTFTNHRRDNGNSFLYNNGLVTSLNDPNLLFFQTYNLQAITPNGTRTLLKNAKVAPSYVGDASMGSPAMYRDNLRNPAVAKFGYASKSFAGQADDPFFLDLRVFDLLYGGDLSEVGNDTLGGYSVQTIALQVPKRDVVNNDPVIGVWSTTSKRDSGGTVRQVSRLGNPLVNEVVIPFKDKNKFNASRPAGDAQFLNYVTRPELPKLIEAIYGIPAPREPRNDLVAVFLTGVEGLNQPKNVVPSEQLRLNTSIAPTTSPNRLGVIGGDNAGYPNGRRLTDDVVDISLQVVEGELVGNKNDLGDAVNRNDKSFGARFPYVALPQNGASTMKPSGYTGNGPAGATALTGGKPDGTSAASSGLSIPVLPASAGALAALLLAAGVLSARRERRGARTVA